MSVKGERVERGELCVEDVAELVGILCRVAVLFRFFRTANTPVNMIL